MGPNQTKNGKDLNTQLSKQDLIDLVGRNNFEFLYVVGKGGFGKVWKVAFKRSNKSYALKEMSKVKIMDRKSEKSIKNERDLLSSLKNDFIVNMIYSFQDYENLYLVMDLLTGGDLRYHISRHKKFSENETKFFICCILQGLEYIHENKVIHRDIKPENLVLDETGYLRITDFGVAKSFSRENSTETSGTPGYMAPEVMCSQNHSYAVDLFAVGVISYEFMNGVRPYYAKSRREIKDLILSKQVQIKKGEIPDGWSSEAADFINKLIQRKPMNRLGYFGIQEVKLHPWIKNFPWCDLNSRKIIPPFVPNPGDNFDKRYCDAPDKCGDETHDRYQNLLRRENYPELFINYTYCDQEEKDKIQKVFIKKHVNHNSQSVLNQPATFKKTNKNKYSASIDFTSTFKSINADKTSNNIFKRNLNISKQNTGQNESKPDFNRSSSRIKDMVTSTYRTPVHYTAKKVDDKLPMIFNPVLKNSKSKEKFSPIKLSVSSSKLKINRVAVPSSNKFASITSNSTGSSTVSLNSLQKKSK